MALVIGNKSDANTIPSATTYTVSHNQNTGDDKYLIVSCVMSNSVDFSGCTYNGVSMTLLASQHHSALSQRWACYGLATTDTGANDIVVSFTGTQWNPISVFATSFTGCAGAGNTGTNDDSTTPNSQTLTVSENSIIYASAISINTITAPDIDSSSRTLEFSHNTNRQVGGAFSAGGLSAGSITVDTKATTGTVTNSRIELQEASSAARRIYLIS